MSPGTCLIPNNFGNLLEVREYVVTGIPLFEIISQSAEPTIPVAPVTNACLNRNKGSVIIGDVVAQLLPNRVALEEYRNKDKKTDWLNEVLTSFSA